MSSKKLNHIQTGNLKTRGNWTSGLSTLLPIFAAVLMVANLGLISFWVPTEKVMGIVQRIFYYHVPLAWVGFLAFFIVFVASIGYLWKGKERWDNIGLAAAELGVVFISLTLVTGIIWDKPVWGVWWVWEPRLTTTLILWLIYIAYLMIRFYAPTPRQGARYGAVLGIVGFIDVPIVYYSVQWWRTVHPVQIVGPDSAPGSIESTMWYTLLFSVVTFTLLFGTLLLERLAQLDCERKLRTISWRLYQTK